MFFFIELPRSYILSNRSVELPGLTQIFFLNVFFMKLIFFLISSFGIKLLAIELSDFLLFFFYVGLSRVRVSQFNLG
jgi:hypothetical protein